MSEWSNVLLVTDTPSSNTIFGAFEYTLEINPVSTPLEWACNSRGDSAQFIDGGCDLSTLIAAPETWRIEGWICPYYDDIQSTPRCSSWEEYETRCPQYDDNILRCSQTLQHFDLHIAYCLAEPVTPHCRVEISSVILLVSVVCGVAKVGSLLLILLLNDFTPLVTIGDSIASFLDVSDRTTSKAGPISTRELRHNSIRPTSIPDPSFSSSSGSSGSLKGAPWSGDKRRWFSAAGKPRWALTFLLYGFEANDLLSNRLSRYLRCVCYWLTFFVVLVICGKYQCSNVPVSWNAGFGSGSISNVIGGTLENTVTSNILITNLPQLLLSIAYFLYNSLLTSMLLTHETDSFALVRKTLRVSHPIPPQRSTYWLQLPYRYAIPQMIAFGALHWAISQSIFLVQIALYDPNGQPGETISSIGWSPAAIATALGIGLVLILALLAMGFRKHHAGMPIMGSCSWAISAACHALTTEIGEEKPALKGLMYGVVGPLGDGFEPVGFSSEEVRPLREGGLYK
ncbi:hypothetical protein MMC13_007528 [Lambiella insularis]|nr:hypothetical protein [Lambiella insularis]